tara:strand:+ start:50 stop:199 length:150 start_codon:yes stop_codon:yes gene_type:complete
VKEREQQHKDLEERYELLVQAVHDMNELIHELRDENRFLKKQIEVLKNE